MPEVKEMKPIVVTRHPALVQLLHERGLLPAGADVLTHVSSPDQVRGRTVIGVLPLHLAAEAAEVVEIPLQLPAELRGKELDIHQLRQYAGPAQRYKVVKLP